MQILTFEELKQRQAEGWRASEKAVRQKYGTYQEIKRLVRMINTGPLDVAEYYGVAMRLGALLHDIKAGFCNTIFHYFADQIDPVRKGDARCFRMECLQLADQIRELDQRRALRHRLTIVK